MHKQWFLQFPQQWPRPLTSWPKICSQLLLSRVKSPQNCFHGFPISNKSKTQDRQTDGQDATLIVASHYRGPHNNWITFTSRDDRRQTNRQTCCDRYVIVTLRDTNSDGLKLKYATQYSAIPNTEPSDLPCAGRCWVDWWSRDFTPAPPTVIVVYDKTDTERLTWTKKPAAMW